MSLKNRSLSDKPLRARLAFYLLLSLLFIIINLLKDLQDESASEAFAEQVLLLPLTFLFVLGVYFFRKKLVVSPVFIGLQRASGINSFWAWVVFTLPISLVLGFFFRLVSYFLNDDDGDGWFDLLFWAISTAILIVAAFVYLLEAYLELEMAENQFSLKIMQVENEKTLAQYQVLKNQLNPHFLFNSFNTLISLVYQSPEKAEKFIHQLSDIDRYNLECGEELVVVLSKEITLIQSYIELKKIRFGSCIEFRCDIPPDKMQHLLPPMTLTLLVENAIKHNHFDRQNPLGIEVKCEGDSLLVGNTYRPKNANNRPPSLGIGLKNLVNQYRLLEAEAPVFWMENERYWAKIPLLEPEI
jgi:sensor histidine kinase YesM